MSDYSLGLRSRVVAEPQILYLLTIAVFFFSSEERKLLRMDMDSTMNHNAKSPTHPLSAPNYSLLGENCLSRRETAPL